jgi:outer membrane protein OmpA-like peptidoglycan-associated protein
MKLKNLYCLAVLGCAAVAAPQAINAQSYTSEAVSVTEFTCDNANHYFSNWRNNWFIQVGAGINQPFVEKGVGLTSGRDAIDRQSMTVVYNFGFGRWFSPYLGFRINALGGSLHWDNPTTKYPDGGWTHAKHVNVNAELMWDMFNSIGGVNANRVFSIIPFVGLGGDYTWRVHNGAGDYAVGTNNYGDKGIKDESWTLPVTAGLNFRFRLCKYVDFFAEARATFYGDNWNLCTYGDPIDVNVQAIGGFNFNIGGRGWSTFNECDYVSQIAALNGQVNDLRNQLIGCAQQVAALEAQLPCPEQKAVVQKDCVNAPLMTTVRFTINSSKIMPTEEVNVYNMAEWLKANPNENVTIVGYADRDTGSADYNMALSERRANAVADALVNNYGIDRDRLTIKYDGSDVQPYSTNDWNRIVIFTQK